MVVCHSRSEMVRLLGRSGQSMERVSHMVFSPPSVQTCAAITSPGRVHARFSFSYGGRIGRISSVSSSMAILSAQSKTDEDYDKLMKSVGAANGAMRKAADPKAAGVEAAKLVALFKDAQQFWTARNNKEAADWAGVGDDARRGSAEGRRSGQRRRRRRAREGARRHLPDLPHEVSRKDRNRLRDQKGLIRSRIV